MRSRVTKNALGPAGLSACGKKGFEYRFSAYRHVASIGILRSHVDWNGTVVVHAVQGHEGRPAGLVGGG